MRSIYKVLFFIAVISLPLERVVIGTPVAYTAKTINSHILTECIRNGIIGHTNIIDSIIYVESRYKRDAVSHAGAVGVMQIMPIALREYNRVNKSGYGLSDLYKPDVNIRIGVWNYKRCYDKYDDLWLALFAYNAGMSRKWYASTYPGKVMARMNRD